MSLRKATHSGGWYTKQRSELSKQLDSWLEQAEILHSPARAIIAPHAGYQYSGDCSAFAYRQINPELVRRIFILGPSHNVYFHKCALTPALKYQTPFYDIRIDLEVNEALYAMGNFEWMDLQTDEGEHSIEMHLPYVAHVMSEYQDRFTLVPILVGSLNYEREKFYGKIFSFYLQDPRNLIIISSDFCHWGQRFRYMYHDQAYEHFYQSIDALDKTAMRFIENLDSSGFKKYLKEYGNTICGKHPISILLEAVKDAMEENPNIIFNLQFLKYTQSNKCRKLHDSSVSYASAAMTCE